MPAFKIGDAEVAGVPFATFTEGTREAHQVVVANDKRAPYHNPREYVVLALDGVAQFAVKIRDGKLVPITLEDATTYSDGARQLAEQEAAAKAKEKEEAAAKAAEEKAAREKAAADAKAAKEAAAAAAAAPAEAAPAEAAPAE